MASDYTWPKPYLLQLYAAAVEQGCIRIKLRGTSRAENDAEFASFKAAFLRLRRKRDANFAVQMRPEFQLVSLKYEPLIGKVLLIFSALPDGDTLPEIEAVDGKRQLPQPTGAIPHETPELEPEFDADAHVRSLLDKIEVEDDDEPSEL